MEELSYSFHLSNDKNKTIKAKQEALNSPSGTTSKNNNAIQNIKHLGKVNHHNLRQYDKKTELITTIKGSNDIIKDVKDLYLDLFDEARINYNNKQVRDDRKIDDYFYKISNDDKHDLACEIIIEIGNMAYWEDKSLEEKYKMTDVFENQLKDLKEIVPDFYIANATIHFDENSPHMHIVGVPVKENCKTGIVIATTVVILVLISMCGRIVIKIVGNEKEYALYSFAISMLSIILTFTNAIGTVAFPLLKNFHYSLEKTYEIFSEIYEELVIICLAVLGIIDIVVTILLAACWPLGEIESITYPYYKIYRKERQFLVIGICAISAVFLLSFAGYLIAGLTGLAWIVLLGISAFFIVLKINFCHKALNERYKCKVKSVSRIIFFIIVGVSLDGLKFLAIYLLGIFLCFLIFFREYRKLYLKIKNVS